MNRFIEKTYCSVAVSGEFIVKRSCFLELVAIIGEVLGKRPRESEFS